MRLFLQGQLCEPDVEGVEEHVGECDACVAILSSLQASDPFEFAIRDAAHRGASGDPEDDRLVARIVSSLDSQSQSISTTVSEGISSPTDLDLSWLSPPEADDELGRVGVFRVLRVIGQGGMGVVFEAEDLKLQRRLALKVMLPKAAADPAGAARFLREARAAAKVRHPNVVTIYQADSFGAVPFIAMELLRGESLHDRLRRVGPLPLKDILSFGTQMTLGLAAAHAQGLLHRDIKPANIWLEQSEDGDVIAKVLDFGLARSVDGDGGLTQSRMIVGTPQYMAPEQARGAPPNVRSDLFSLGCVLYQMTTGRQPFVGRNVLDQLRALAVDVPPPVSELRENAPTELSRLIHDLLEKAPSSRPTSATDVADRLREIATTQTQPPHVDHGSWRRWTLAAIVLVSVLLAVGTAFRRNRPISGGTQLTSPTSATGQPVTAKPEPSNSTPREKPIVDSVDLRTATPGPEGLTTGGVRDPLKRAGVKSSDACLFWTAKGPDGRVIIKRARIDDDKGTTTVLEFDERADQWDGRIAIDDRNQRLYIGLPRQGDRDSRILSADFDGGRIRDRLRNNFVWGLCIDPTQERLYVSGGGSSGIFSVGLAGDSASRRDFTIPKTFYASGLTIDQFERKLYWAEAGTFVRGGKLQRSNLEGTQVEDIITRLFEPTGITIDPQDRKIYWAESEPCRIRSANYDGSNIKTLMTGAYTNRNDNYWDLTFDEPTRKLYFISYAAIARCDRDGSNLEQLFSPGGNCLKITREASQDLTVKRKVPVDLEPPVSGDPIPTTVLQISKGLTGLHEFTAVGCSQQTTLVVWQGKESQRADWDIYGSVLGRDGSCGTPFVINETRMHDQSKPSVAADDNGSFVVAWESMNQDGSDSGIFARRIGPDEQLSGREFQVNSYTTKSQAAPRIGSNRDGRLLIVWTSLYQVKGQDVFGQFYTQIGAPDGPEFRVNESVIFNQRNPAAAIMADGSAVVVYEREKGDNALYDIGIQRYAPDGAPLGGETLANTHTHHTAPYGKGVPNIGTDGVRRFVVVWHDFHGRSPQDGSESGVFAQLFDLSGNKVGQEFQINETSQGMQADPSIAMFENGNFIVVWQGSGSVGRRGVFGRLFNSDGKPNGGEMCLGEMTNGHPLYPRVASRRNGQDVVVVWHGDGPQSEKGVFGKWLPAMKR